MWLGTALAIVSGLLLLCVYPAKVLTNPVFAAKLMFLIGAALLLQTLLRRAAPDQRARTKYRHIAPDSLALYR
jgi:Flp pilus assembly protein TadB